MTSGLDQLEVAQADVAVADDDQVVVQIEAERGHGFLDFLGHLEVAKSATPFPAALLKIRFDLRLSWSPGELLAPAPDCV
jgi:hypothetical protein